jgi:hypothetical protein
MPLWFDLMMSGSTAASGGLLLATAANSKVSKTTDGITWTAANPFFGVYDVNSAGMDSTYAVVVANGGNLATAPYPSISAWTNRTSSFGSTNILSVLKYGSTWVASGQSLKLATASDPTSTWTQNSSSGITGSQINYLMQGDTKLYATTDADTLWETTNPAGTWTNVTPSFGGASANFRKFAWNGSLYVMAIRISTGGTSGRHEIWTATSISGTWTQRYTETYSSAGNSNTQAYYLGGSFFVPIPNGSFRISSDGITWAAGTPPVSPIPANVRMAYIAGNYVWGTTGPNVYYSPNYTTWTSVNSQVGSNAINSLVVG